MCGRILISGWRIAAAVLIAVAGLASRVSAQTVRAICPDTVLADRYSPLLSFNCKLSTERTGPAEALCYIVDDGNWGQLKKGEIKLALAAPASTVFAVNLIRKKSIPAAFSRIELVICSGGDTIRKSVTVKKEIQIDFETGFVGSNGEYLLAEDSAAVTIPYRIRNRSNVSSTFLAKVRLPDLQQESSTSFNLAAGADSIVCWQFHPDKSLRNKLQHQPVFIEVIQDKGGTRFLNTYISSSSHIQRGFKATDLDVVSLEVGAYNRGESGMGYGQISGRKHIGKSGLLDFSYRTEEYTQLNRYQGDVFRVQYSSTHFDVYAGQISRLTDFTTAGNEVSVAARWGKGSGISLWGMKSYKYALYGSDQVGGEFHHKLWKGSVQYSLAALVDSLPVSTGLGTLKYILSPAAGLKIELRGGVGTDSLSRMSNVSGLGKFVGYSIIYSRKNFRLHSVLESRDEKYPGLFRGNKMQSHDFTVDLTKSFQLIAFYNSNSSMNRFQVDTLLRTNLSLFNMRQFGLRGAMTMRSVQLTASLGKYYSVNGENVNAYNSVDFGVTLAKPGFLVTFNSQSGFSTDKANAENDWFTSSSLRMSARRAQVTLGYFRYPSNFFTAIKDPGSPQSTYNAVAAYELLKGKSYSLFINYSASKYSVSDVLNDIGGQFKYSIPSWNTHIALSGSVPISVASANSASYLYGRNYVQMAIRKDFGIPRSPLMKLVNLKVRFFVDDNSNGIFEKGEQCIAGGSVRIGTAYFTTDKNGMLQYKAIARGNYEMDLSQMTQLNGFVLVGGILQHLDVQSSQTIDIAYKRGKTLRGRFEIKADELGTRRISPAGYKIIARNATGKEFYTITGEDGAFLMTLPEDVYTISINQASIDSNAYSLEHAMESVDLISGPAPFVNLIIATKRREMHMLNKTGVR
jgi:hypothetical protein